MNFADKIVVIRRRMDELIKGTVKRESAESAPVYQRVCYLKVAGNFGSLVQLYRNLMEV